MNSNLQTGSLVSAVPVPAAVSVARAAAVVLFALLTAVSAQIAIPVPGTPVPMTLQTAVVFCAGAMLGARLGVLSMGLYLLLGAVGVHVFHAGTWGLATIAGSTGGYLLGFVIAQPVIAAFTARPRATIAHYAAGVLLGAAIVFACGVAWLAVWLSEPIGAALQRGLLPFLPTELLKLTATIAVARAAAGPLRRALRLSA